MTGSIPSQVGLLPLRKLELQNNVLTGSIPTELGQIPDLDELWLSYNRLPGTLPNFSANQDALRLFSAGNNNLSGNVERFFSATPSTALLAVNLMKNELTGSIPTSIGKYTKLVLLAMSENLLSGPIPSELGRLTNLQELYLAGNSLTGTVPGSLALLPKLGASQTFASMPFMVW